MISPPPLSGRELGVSRDARILFRHLNLELVPGRVLHVTGSNGAGKTTLLRILCGLTPADDGEVLWHGQPLDRCRPVFHAELLYLGHQPGLKLELTPLENLRWSLALRGQRKTAQTLDEALAAVALTGYEDVPVATLSAGQRRRVGLARLWLEHASLWVLDEPLTALDSSGGGRLHARLAEHAGAGGMAVVTSHQALSLPPGVDMQQLGLDT